MKIAMLAPPWIAIPPMRYGGIEAVVAPLTDRLVDLGHEVVLFCAPGSTSKAEVRPVLPRAYPNKIGMALQEVDHVTRVLDVLDVEDFDLLHDHTMTAITIAKRIGTPVVHTMHNGHAGDLREFYERRNGDALLVAISEDQRRTAPSSIKIAGVVPNPLNVDEWPYVAASQKGNYALWIGRLDDAKGPDRAIEAIKKTDMPLIIAGPVQPGQEGYFRDHVAPHLNDQIRYIGEIGGRRKKDLFAYARAVLMPINWDEPFGMVMVEAHACGTPVIAFNRGAAREIVIEGVNGRLVEDEIEMSDALIDIEAINSLDCRESVRARYSAVIVADRYVEIYERAMGDQHFNEVIARAGQMEQDHVRQ